MENVTNNKYGRLTALSFHHMGKGHKAFWLFQCDCGNQKISPLITVRRGESRSCGCITQERLRRGIRLVHGDSKRGRKARLYEIWTSMLKRCTNANSISYRRYGGRGIKVCADWLNYECFKRWAMQNDYNDNLSIERINNNGDYEPANCKWATRKDQARNRNTSRFLEYNGEFKTMASWAELYNIPYQCFVRRLLRGWDMKDALTKPLRQTKKLVGI